MSNKELSTDLPAAVHLGPVELMPGVNRTNAITKLYASGITIAALTGMSILQAYNLTEHLEIPRRARGTIFIGWGLSGAPALLCSDSQVYNTGTRNFRTDIGK